MSNARSVAHKKATSLLHRGAYAEAISALQKCLDEYGPHVGPLSDLVFAAYLHEDMGLFALAVEWLESEFSLSREKLSAASQAKTRVVLSKSYELQGRIAESFSEIEIVLKLLAKGDPLHFQVRCQKLRLLASFGRETEVTTLYQQCLGVSDADAQVMIECFHALLLAEVRLFGLAATWPRFLHLSKTKHLQAMDLRLCLIDLLEVALESRDDFSRQLILEYIDKNELNEFDHYESILLQMAREPEKALGFSDVFAWTRRMPLFGIIRLLALELIRRGDQGSTEIQKQFLFHVQSLDHRSRRMLTKKWGTILDVPAGVAIRLEAKNKSLHFGKKGLSFAKSPQGWDVLAILGKEKEVSPDRLLSLLGKKSEYQNLESLRISLLRLNRKLSQFLSIDWVIRFSKEKIKINPGIEIHS